MDSCGILVRITSVFEFVFRHFVDLAEITIVYKYNIIFYNTLLKNAIRSDTINKNYLGEFMLCTEFW